MNLEWQLKEINIELQSWGADKGTYTGHIRFTNGENESIRFKIRENMAQGYLDLIANEIVIHANELGKRLAASMGVKHGSNQ